MSRSESALAHTMKVKIDYGVFVLYAVLIAYVSLRPADVTVPGQWDKVGHFVTYAVFSVLGARLSKAPGRYLLICIGIVAYGGLMEFGQSFMPDRMMSAYDFLANAIGVAVGAIFARVISRRERYYEPV